MLPKYVWNGQAWHKVETDDAVTPLGNKAFRCHCGVTIDARCLKSDDDALAGSKLCALCATPPHASLKAQIRTMQAKNHGRRSP